MSCCDDKQNREAAQACCSVPNASVKPDDVSKATRILGVMLALGLVAVAVLALVDLFG